MSGNVNVLRTHVGPFLSDRAAVITQLNVKRLNLDRQKKVIRKIKEISANQWIQAYENKDLQLSDDLEQMVMNLDDALKSILDDLAPEKQVTIPLKPKQPWYTKDLRTLKYKVRRLEKKWLRHKLESGWIAYKKVRNLYHAKLNHSKREVLRSKISDCHGDSKSPQTGE